MRKRAELIAEIVLKDGEIERQRARVATLLDENRRLRHDLERAIANHCADLSADQ